MNAFDEGFVEEYRAADRAVGAANRAWSQALSAVRALDDDDADEEARELALDQLNQATADYMRALGYRKGLRDAVMLLLGMDAAEDLFRAASRPTDDASQ